MSSLKNKKVLLAVSGGIAAYKSPEIVRALVKKGAKVQVILSKSAREFVTPLTLQSLSGQKVLEDIFVPEAPDGMDHIHLGQHHDVMLVAPLSANRLAALAHGLGDDLLSTVFLAAKCPVFLAPAMNTRMWHHPATQTNLELVKRFGGQILGPEYGEQACKAVGLGRMMAPLDLVEALEASFNDPRTIDGGLGGKKILISAGPTQEALDPVRYLSNRSSGKMGGALARVALKMGAQVTLVMGPSHLAPPDGATVIRVKSASQMAEKILENYQRFDIFISAAAVCDYRAKDMYPHKMKKGPNEEITLTLVKNPDILAQVAHQSPRPYCVGFAAETQHVLENARRKLIQKGVDLIAVNDVSQQDRGFEVDQNALCLIWENGQKEIPLGSKEEVAHTLLTFIGAQQHAKS